MNGTVNIRKTNCVIQWIEIYPMNSIIHIYNQGQHIVVLNNMGLDSMLLRHWIKIFPDLASTLRIHSVLKSFHSGERIKKNVDSSAGFTGYVWTEAKSAKKRWWDLIISGYVWTRPETRFTTIDSILNKHSVRTLRALEHLGPVDMEVGTPGRGGNPQVESPARLSI